MYPKFRRVPLWEGYSYDNWKMGMMSFARDYVYNPRRFKLIKRYADDFILIKFEDTNYGKSKGELIHIQGSMGFSDWNFITNPKQTEMLLTNDKYRRKIENLKYNK